MDTPTTRACGLHAARLTPADYAANFGAAHPPLTRPRALIEAERCYYCHDAPCTTACPTGIDVPSFIQRIAQDNDRGAARAILQAKPLGGICARVCPTELLCEQACVRNSHEDKPVAIRGSQRPPHTLPFPPPGAPPCPRARRPGAAVWPWSGRGLRAWPAPMAWRCAATPWCCSRRVRNRAASMNMAWPA